MLCVTVLQYVLCVAALSVLPCPMCDLISQCTLQGELLLRKTAWCVFDSACTCAYGYSDTWQNQITDPRMKGVLLDISQAVHRVCAASSLDMQADSNQALFNCVNLNYYPTGGGVGFHADDEFLFDGLRRCSFPSSPPLVPPFPSPRPSLPPSLILPLPPAVSGGCS